MRIGIASDVHLHRPEHAEEIQELLLHINAQQLDLMVFAGDISHRTAEIRGFLGALAPACPRVWVPGNHDVWVIEPESPQDTAGYRYRELFGRLSAEVGWYYLPEAPLRLPEHRLTVVGNIGWLPDPGFSEWFDARASDADAALARGFAEGLARALENAEPGDRILVVTHHAPPLEVLSRFADRIALAVHGHEHRRHGPSSVQGVLLIAHPFGYPDQHEDALDGLRILEIP
jgi:3',5'-cyclic AMP phosphodiesterase CpdA